jgi:hypothetical protein
MILKVDVWHDIDFSVSPLQISGERAYRLRASRKSTCVKDKSCLFSWLQYRLQFASKDGILLLDQQGEATMLDVSLMLVAGSIAADPSKGGQWRVEGAIVL